MNKHSFRRDYFGLPFFIALFSSMGLLGTFWQCKQPNADSNLQTKAKVELKFRSDSTFKIAQFTDIHWQEKDTANNLRNKAMIRYVLSTEKPDLVVLTGDIVNDPAAAGWGSVAAIFQEFEIPFAVTLGNHDDESDWSRAQIFDFLETIPGFVGEKGPATIHGTGNYFLRIQDQQNETTAAILYFFDSNAYCKNKKISDYDWIRFDQIEWYRNLSKQLKVENNGNPYPAIAFFHIPLPEYKQIIGGKTTVGTQNEGVASPDLNSGLFSSFVEMQDVMGTFVGHDHDNNYIGILAEIALAYGQSSGFSAYGSIGKGARIIELHQDVFSFNTWIITEDSTYQHYNYPFGYSFKESRLDLIPSVDLIDEEAGLKYHYYEGKFESVEDISKGNLRKSGVVECLRIDLAEVEDHFGIVFEGFLKVEHDGLYRFYTYSDDGSALYIGENLVVDNDGGHSARRKEGMIALQAGLHPFRLLYFEDYMGQILEAGFSSLNKRESEFETQMFFHRK